MVRRRAVLLAAPAVLAARAVVAQEFPNRPVTIIVASPAGGGTDFSARLIAEPLAARLGQPVVVENRPGGNGTIGLLATARARPDGHTLTVGYSGTMTGRPAVEGTGDLDPQADFAPIALPGPTVNPSAALPNIIVQYVRPAGWAVRVWAELLIPIPLPLVKLNSGSVY